MKKNLLKVYNLYRRFSAAYSSRSLGAYSSQAAFFLFISFFPFCALLFGTIKALPFRGADAGAKIALALPGIMGNVITEAYASAGKYPAAAVIPITAILTLWASSKGVFAVACGVESAYGGKAPGGLKKRALSILHTLFLIASLILSLFLLVFGNFVFSFLTELFPALTKLAIALKALRAALTFATISVFFILVYMFFPARKQRLRDTLPGAALSGLSWIAISYGYSLYIDYYMSKGSTLYGSLTAAVLLLFWLDMCMSVTLAGGLLNSYLLRNRAKRLL